MMVNVNLGEEMRKNVIIIMSRAWDIEKKSESPTGIVPMSSCTLVRCSHH